MKKINVKTMSIKEKICETCGMQKTCADLSGFCALIFYIPVALAITIVTYFVITM